MFLFLVKDVLRQCAAEAVPLMDAGHGQWTSMDNISCSPLIVDHSRIYAAFSRVF